MSPGPRWPRRRLGGLVVGLVVLVVVGWLVATGSRDGSDEEVRSISTQPPDRAGYFRTSPPGAWDDLPSGKTCAGRVHRSTWEPRPSNETANHTRPKPSDVRGSFMVRPRGNGHTYSTEFNTWLLRRVDGQHTGSTDENIQWAACKWGISDNLLRAMAAAESTWFQGVRKTDGSCVEKRGCGDVVQEATPAARVFCDEVDRYGYDYQDDYAQGVCPKTFSIIGVMAWQDPEWGQMWNNQNGTFPFSRDSTAFALDYAAAHLRGCMEGWITWLANRDGFERGDVWGCVGVWYAGDWEIPTARQYAARVRSLMDERFWLRPDFAE